MPQAKYPFPATLVWRNRHLFTGDTTPPTRAGSVPSLSTRTPFLETRTSGDGGGIHDPETRAIGMGEEARSSVFNRPLYALACGQDMLMEKDDAELVVRTAVGVASAGVNNLINVSTAFGDRLIYLGPEGTTGAGGADPEKWCGNYVKVWGAGAQSPVYSPVTGDVYQVVDIFDSGGTSSVYGNHPLDAQVYPLGTPGVLTNVAAAPATTVQFFTGGFDVPPVGTAGTPQYQGFFNYSQFERALSTVGGDPTTAYAACLSSAGAVPATYTLDRAVAGLGWLAGDVVYLTHFMYSPRISMSEAYSVAGESALLYGTAKLAALGATRRFMDLLRFVDRSVLPMPLEVTEPAAATLRSFDYANALIRAVDGTMRGTIGFDFRGGSDRDIPGGGTDLDDAYSGFMHRKVMSFATTNYAEVAEDEGVSWVGSTITLTGFPASHFHGPAAVNTQILLGVDMAELTTAAGVIIGLYVISSFGGAGATCDITNLDGSVPVLGADAGTLRIYRPQFRTGIWDSTGVLTGVFGGVLFVGDDFDTDTYPAVGALAVGSSDIITGWNSSVPRDLAAPNSDGSVIPRFRVLYTGGLYLNGVYDGASQMYTEISGGPRAGTTWSGAGTSWTVDLGTAVTGVAKPWSGRHLYIHALDANAGDDSLYAQLSVTAGPVAGLGAGEHAGMWMGFPGVAYPMAATVRAGDRNAGYVFSFNNGGSMELGVGFTTAVPTMRGFTLRETPTDHVPPAGQFPASPARLELGAAVSIGWQTAKTFYQQLVPAAARGRSAEAWLFKLNYDGGGDATERCAWESPSGTAAADDFRLVFPVNLPHGVHITDVVVHFFVTGTGASVTANFTQCKTNTNKNDTNASSGATAIPAGATAVNFDPAMTVDTDEYFYQLWAGVDPDNAAVVQVFGARITYEMMDILPT